ncbi:hypothetical protein PILCRDRAFT_92651 [Piloderma croceum F 1598]|uniref:Uncharacterized protein n=1 Tax=Piloderma croceum (strain F 1598) TaxID=765440 RepID=A0A0C3AKE2_PILCF|nr:hypothetical protein PILCRDRAFT_92651 [Piloderma croceum F 1598]
MALTFGKGRDPDSGEVSGVSVPTEGGVWGWSRGKAMEWEVGEEMDSVGLGWSIECWACIGITILDNGQVWAQEYHSATTLVTGIWPEWHTTEYITFYGSGSGQPDLQDNQYGGMDFIDFIGSQDQSAHQSPMNYLPPATAGNVPYSEHVDQSFGAISSIGTLPSISNAPTHGNAPAVNTADIFGLFPSLNPVPNVNIAMNTTTTTARPPKKRPRVTKLTTELDDDNDRIPKGDPTNPINIGYWRKEDKAGGKYIDKFERFLHRHVIKTGSITFRLNEPDPLLIQMLQDTRMKYLEQPGRPVPIQFEVTPKFTRFASSHASRLRNNDNQKSGRALYHQSDPDNFNYGMFNSGKDVILPPWTVYFNILRNAQLRHRANFLNIEENGITRFFMSKPFHNALLAVVFGWRGCKDIQNPIAKGWPGSEEALIEEWLAYVGASTQDGILCTFPMEQESYGPVFSTLLTKAKELAQLPEYQQLLRDLFKAGNTYSLPNKTTIAAAFRPLDFPE